MSDEIAKIFEAQKPLEEHPKRSFTLMITLQPNGELELSGPLNNKVLAFGLLGAATSQLSNSYLKEELKQASSRGGMNGLLKRMNGG